MSEKMLRIAPVVLCVAIGVTSNQAIGAEVVLKATTALPRNLSSVKSFLSNFVAPLNTAGKGLVQAKYLGGPEVVSGRKALGALQRGVIDMLRSPAAYYAGTVPEASVLAGSNLSVEEVRRRGGMDLLNQIWHEKAKAHILGWADSGTKMNLYLTRRPKIVNNGPDLSGMKMRTTSTYTGLLKALGATPVSISSREIHTGLERGVINGFGWPSTDILAIGVAKLVKFRVDPGFYRINALVIVSLEKWNSLSRAAQDLLEKTGHAYEQSSIRTMRAAAKVEEDTLKKGGMEILALPPSVAKVYLSAAYDSMWEQIAKRAPDNVTALRAKFYQ